MNKNHYLTSKTGEVFCVYRAKVYLSGDSETIRDLLARGFLVCHPEHENQLFDTLIANEIVEIHAIKATGIGDCDWNWDVALFQDYYFAANSDPDFIAATILYTMRYDLLAGYNIKTEPFSWKTLIYICEMLEQEGRQKFVDDIKNSYPVVGYVMDKNQQKTYFGNPVNKEKTFDDFIKYAEKCVKKLKHIHKREPSDCDLVYQNTP